jgi:hypothetical protein
LIEQKCLEQVRATLDLAIQQYIQAKKGK